LPSVAGCGFSGSRRAWALPRIASFIQVALAKRWHGTWSGGHLTCHMASPVPKRAQSSAVYRAASLRDVPTTATCQIG
jgi:hypothetical protein